VWLYVLQDLRSVQLLYNIQLLFTVANIHAKRTFILTKGG
jgi:hypothetical protein